jgi:diguanylate cyclase (GGDEF)-like protein
MPTLDRLDPDSAARRPIDALMRRVVLMLFAAGNLAIMVNWAMEWHDGSLNAANAVAYPVMCVVDLGCLAALWRWPRLLAPVRWAGFLCVVIVLLTELAQEAGSDVPMIGNYNAVTLLNWLPLCYALAFFLLGGRAAAWATGFILAFISAMAVWRGMLPVPHGDSDRALLVNTVFAHVVLVVCLSSMLWLKRVVTRQVEQAQQLRLLAGTDPLTGLANRRQALYLLERLVADRRSESAPVVLLGDLDHFKRINDRCGHEMGDFVLCEVATALRDHTRESDTVARWGGEEFLVVLPRTRPCEAAELGERLRACIEALSIADVRGRPVPVTLSVGIAALGAQDTVAAWLRRADEALYRAKDSGRNRCEEAPEGDVAVAISSMSDEA